MRRIMKRSIYIFTAMLLLSVCLCAAAGASYSVRALPPENQEDKDAWFFDLVVEPGQKQVLEALVMNLSEEEIEVMVEANDASTNCNGVIEFTGGLERDPSMAVVFSEIFVPVEAVVTVPPLSQAIMEFTLTVPEEPFDGIVYGGLLFTKLDQEPAEDQGAMGISNVYRFAIGARLRVNEEDADAAFELVGAEMDMGDMPALVLNLRNTAPVLARGITLSAELCPAGGGEAAAAFERSGIEMAPNSAMPYRIDLFDEELPEKGNYRVVVKLGYEDRELTFDAPLRVE